MRKLGKQQKWVLLLLLERGQWTPGGGGYLYTDSQIEGVAKTLVKRGLVTVTVDNRRRNDSRDRCTYHAKLGRWTVAKVRRPNADFLWNAVRYENGQPIEADVTPTHSSELARKLADELNVKEACA